MLGDVLKPFDISFYSWRIGDEESYLVVDDRLNEELFTKEIVEGNELKTLLENNKYYLIFADLQAYPRDETSEVRTYEEFIDSKCELVLLVVDCSHVSPSIVKTMKKSSYFIKMQKNMVLQMSNILPIKMIQEQDYLYHNEKRIIPNKGLIIDTIPIGKRGRKHVVNDKLD